MSTIISIEEDFGSLLPARTVTVKALWKSVSRLMRRASFFETSFYYTKFDFLQFLGVLTIGYIICILLLYLTNMVSYFWISSADLIGPDRHSISLVIKSNIQAIMEWKMEPFTNYTKKFDFNFTSRQIFKVMRPNRINQPSRAPSGINLHEKKVNNRHWGRG